MLTSVRPHEKNLNCHAQKNIQSSDRTKKLGRYIQERGRKKNNTVHSCMVKIKIRYDKKREEEIDSCSTFFLIILFAFSRIRIILFAISRIQILPQGRFIGKQTFFCSSHPLPVRLQPTNDNLSHSLIMAQSVPSLTGHAFSKKGGQRILRPVFSHICKKRTKPMSTEGTHCKKKIYNVRHRAQF